MRALTKVLRDLWLTRGRVAFMVLSLAAGLTSLGAVLSMRGVIGREMTRAYMDSVPASATFDLGERGMDDATLEALRARPEVAAAERRATRVARWRRPGEEWGRALLFVIEDFEHQELALLGHERGRRVLGTGEVLVERSAMAVLDAELGDRIELATARGRAEVEIVGVVHEPALAPASTEQAGYFYATPETLAHLGEPAQLDEVRVLVNEEPLDRASVEAQVEVLFAWLETQGVDVHEVRVPPPGTHPHEAPSRVVLLLFAIFAGLTVVLAAVLCASLFSITMARQVREVGVMKTLGATNGRIRSMYALMLGLVGVAALAVAAGPTRLLGRAGIATISSLLNFDIVDHTVPHWVYATQFITGLALPLLAAAPAILRASRVSVREALGDHGAQPPKPGVERWIGARGGRLMQAALRNALRLPRRLVLTLALLSVGGALFVGAVSVADAWEAVTEQVYETRHYDLELRLARAVDASVMRDSVMRDSVTRELEGPAEPWGFAPVTLATESGMPLSRTYPDQGHGSFTLTGVPDDTQLIDFELRSGRWLRPGEGDGVVLNQLAAARIGDEVLGQPVELVVEGRRARWTVVGVVEEVAAPATAYVSSAAFVERTGQPLRGLRIATGSGHDAEGTRAAIATIERSLAAAGVGVVASVPLELLYNAMGEHVVVLIRSLLGLALLMAFVSALALGSNMSTSVVERMREIGVMQAIGARPRQVRSMVLIEGLFVTLLSLPLAYLLAVPFAATVGYVIGQLSFAIPLPLDLSWLAMIAWALGALLVATLASLVPARAATRRSVTDALAQV